MTTIDKLIMEINSKKLDELYKHELKKLKRALANGR